MQDTPRTGKCDTDTRSLPSLHPLTGITLILVSSNQTSCSACSPSSHSPVSCSLTFSPPTHLQSHTPFNFKHPPTRLDPFHLHPLIRSLTHPTSTLTPGNSVSNKMRMDFASSPLRVCWRTKASWIDVQPRGGDDFDEVEAEWEDEVVVRGML